ncbi:MAG TPA: outer membrane protein transport protein [Thermoanaerobaculia bacterium]|nr:outer membrane protein transport protein [Thermoanaerobaculia bacterium]
MITLACLLSAPVFGAGFSIFEQGAKASGMAGAFVATADDPSAVFYNPAGLAQQRELSVLAGATFINFTNEFNGDPNDPFTAGTEAKYDRHTFVPPNAYAILPIGQNLTVGIGVFAAWGLRTDWADPWVGRFISRDADLKTTSVEPAIAWQSASGNLAIGGGVEYRRARVILNQNLALPFPNPFTGRITDIGNARLESEYGDDIGYNAGILFKTDRFRFGASYRSEMDIDLEGNADFTQISTGNAGLDALVAGTFPVDDNITTTLPFPAILAAGVAFMPTDRVELEFDITHMTWSRFEALAVDFENQPARSFVREQEWNDSSCYRLGANIKATPDWDVRLGVLYDENPQPTERVGPLLPDSDRLGATFGFGYHKGPFIVDVAAFILHFKDRNTNGQSAEGFNGTYQTDATLWSFNLGYRF